MVSAVNLKAAIAAISRPKYGNGHLIGLFWTLSEQDQQELSDALKVDGSPAALRAWQVWHDHREWRAYVPDN